MPSKPFASQVPSPRKISNAAVARIARQRVLLDEGLRDLEAGRVVPDHEVDAMLDRLVAGQPLSKASKKLK